MPSVLSEERLEEILSTLPEIKVAVVGDFFLDRYLEIDPRLSEISLETGLEAHQIVRIRSEPGAAGTVARNLAALGVGKIFGVGAIGQDGEGFELRKALAKWCIDLSELIETPDRFTPSYIKPLRVEKGRPPEELNRHDIKNRQPTPDALEEEILSCIERIIPAVSGVILLDQVTETNCGVLTDRVIDSVRSFASRYPEKTFIADSRSGIAKFCGCTLKLNQREATRVFESNPETEAPLSRIRGYADRLAEQSGKPVFLTIGADGISTHSRANRGHVKTMELPPPLDIVGAGDSATAGIVSALCCGASVIEAAAVGNIVASLTVQQVGTTGYASPPQVRDRWRQFHTRGIV